MRLKDIMSRDVKKVSPSTKAKTAYETMQRHDIYHLVVMENQSVVGVVSERDLGGKRGAPLRKNLAVEEFMTSPVVAAGPDDTLRQAANKLRGRGIGCLPVINKGKLAGIVTVSDCLELIGRGVEKPIGKSERAMRSKKSGRSSH